MTASPQRRRWLRAVAPIAGVAALLLTGCDADQPGAAAIIGSERISESLLQSSAEDVLALQEQTGAPTSPTEQVLQTQLTEQVENALVSQIAEERGITVSEGQVRDLIAQTREQAGEQFDTQLARAGLAPENLEDYTRKFLLRDQIARELAESSDNVEEAYTQLLVETGNAIGVQIAPRYGSWDPQEGFGPPPDDLSKPLSFATQQN